MFKWFNLKTESRSVRHATVKSHLSRLKALSLIRNIPKSEHVVAGGIELENALLGSLEPSLPLVRLAGRLYQPPDIVKGLPV